MKNENVLYPYYKQLYDKLKAEDFVIDKTGVKVVELIDCNIKFLNPQQALLDFGERKTPEKYVAKELKWYDSQSLSIKGYVDDVKIWTQVADKYGYINSNYGWCIYSPENCNQYNKCLEALVAQKDSRRACMIYTRPSMQYDYCRDGMSDFCCTFCTQQLIRDNKLYYIVTMRSNDGIYGFFNDFYFHATIYMRLYEDLKKTYPDLEVGYINWNAASFHVYERHFEMLTKMVEEFKS